MNKSCCTTNSNSNIDQFMSASDLKITKLSCDDDTISIKCASTSVKNPESYILNYTPYSTDVTFSASYYGTEYVSIPIAKINNEEVIKKYILGLIRLSPEFAKETIDKLAELDPNDNLSADLRAMFRSAIVTYVENEIVSEQFLLKNISYIGLSSILQKHRKFLEGENPEYRVLKMKLSVLYDDKIDF